MKYGKMTAILHWWKKKSGYLAGSGHYPVYQPFYRGTRLSPTIRDIVHGCGISSTSVVNYNLEILVQRGYIRRHREVSRGIELVRKPVARDHRLMIVHDFAYCDVVYDGYEPSNSLD
jgi:hypothetical protein